MSKAVGKFFDKVKTRFNVAKKFKGSYTPGSRILPAKTPKNDTEYQLRVDAGELIENRWRDIILQVNSQAKSQGLRDWLRNHGRTTHGKLATSRFDTLAENDCEEALRVLNDLEEMAKENLKNLTG
ncbi:hypothetical protein EMCG_01598 [[Emmonsia] crescens]|uniref:Uncharacterized protein n=1 Tax=[Emmonsia] crescens TaxID=73230 RepID=A0A0G2J9J7_9EURO|nr:hypothetical protein EMCG_01598 [Emmonsia crescens UAMH 3008]